MEEGRVLKVGTLNDRVDGARFLAEPTENALSHINVVFSGPSGAIRPWFGFNSNGESWASSLTEFAGDAPFLASRVPAKSVLTSKHRTEGSAYNVAMYGGVVTDVDAVNDFTGGEAAFGRFQLNNLYHGGPNNIDKFNSALLQLPILQREAFIFQQEGFSIIDICELTHSSHETVKSRLRYARTYLKKHDRNIVMSADKFDKEIESLYIERKQSIKAPTIAFNAVPKKPKARLMESLSILAMGGIASFSIFAVINHFAHIKPETSESLLLDSTALQVASVLADKNVKQFTLKPIYKVMPVFSRTATHENGQIKLTYKVNAKGAVDNIRIMESSVNRTLEKSAKKALSQWQFTPGMNTEEKLHIVFQFNNE